MTATRKFDRTFLIATLLLLSGGFLVFTSASLGLLARETGASFASVAFNQAFFGIALGVAALICTSQLNYRVWRKYAFYIYLASLVLTALVFVPGIGFSSGGAARWLHIGPLSLQPSEFLKLGFVLYFAAWLSSVRTKVRDPRFGIIPFIIIAGIAGGILLAEPDTGSFMVIASAGLAMLIAAGVRWRDVAVIIMVALIAIAVLASARPYVKSRITTFLDPSRDPRGAGYQIQQSLIAVGSGGLSGRGFGQSIQKFNYLPEPIGDSIFAVAAEEFGFLGSVLLIGLFLFLGLRGLKIATRAPDRFGGLVTLGIVILIVSESYINIGSMIGILPLTGLPMLFVSHGGTAMLFALAEIGIVLNISRYTTPS